MTTKQLTVYVLVILLLSAGGLYAQVGPPIIIPADPPFQPPAPIYPIHTGGSGPSAATTGVIAAGAVVGVILVYKLIKRHHHKAAAAITRTGEAK